MSAGPSTPTPRGTTYATPSDAGRGPVAPVPRPALSSSPSPAPSPSRVSKKQTVDQLREGLAQLGLDTKGKKETLWRRVGLRLVNALHRATLRDPPSDDSDSDVDPDPSELSDADPKSSGFDQGTRIKQPYKSYLCFDVEATCRPGKEFDYPNEIIEFPVVLLRWTEDASGRRTLVKVDQFRSYVRPTWKPVLSEFCKTLTGISQQTVDQSPTFPEMLKGFEKWLDKWDLRTDKGLKDALWVTDGPWDLRDFVPKQLHITPPNPHPPYFHGPYLNVKFAVQAVLSEEHRRKAYAAEHPHDPPTHRAMSPITTQRVSKLDKTRGGKARDVGKSFYFNIPGMVEVLDLGEFEGRQHSGLDDATNIARILIALSEKGVVIEANGRIQPMGSGRRYPWMGEKGEVVWEEWMSSNKELGPATSGGVAEAKEAKGAKRVSGTGGHKENGNVPPGENAVVPKADLAENETRSVGGASGSLEKLDSMEMDGDSGVQKGPGVPAREASEERGQPDCPQGGVAGLEEGVERLKLSREVELAPIVKL